MGRARDRRGGLNIPIQTLDAATLGRLDRIVCGRVVARSERRRHAGLLAALSLSGLCMALAMPLATLAGMPTHLVVAPAALSSLCLILAAVLSATGAFDAVAGAAVAALSLALALGATGAGGVASPLLLLLPLAPLECFLARRRALMLVSVATASLAFGFVIAADQLGLVTDAAHPAVFVGVAVCGLVYAGVQALRLRGGLDRRRAASEAEKSERRLVEHMLGEAVLRFSPDGSLIHASEGAAGFFDRMGSDGRHPFLMSCVHIADRVRYLSAFGDLRAGAASTSCEVRLADGDGQGFVEAALELMAIRDARGHLVSIMVVVARPSVASAPDEHLRRELDEARELSDAKSSFLAMVSHELRTPLNAIIGFSDILDQEFFGAFESPRQKEYVGLIRQSGEHLLSVVNGLLDVSKIEAGHYELDKECFSPGELLAGALAAVRGDADRKNIALEIRDEFSPRTLDADRRAVYQILLNLLSNAVKFTDEGRVTLTARSDGAFLALSVTDTGAGIAASELPKLGRPFVQGSCGLARRHVGTGLGLSLVKGLAELHGGAMTISSEIGRGTTVLVTLRRDAAASPALNDDDNRERIVALKNGRTNHNNQATRETRRSA
ncbi:sensor histidine kinase [Aureimonas psammosilenae]|uniref:sensor histidine kinase n=1 Tax=Aureimonas psammosilenae TaxID=2495496 RepID=UPI0012609BCC|nr:HAMP domain-containing sensor histidine kinase [Aureimonas psammosilenae]